MTLEAFFEKFEQFTDAPNAVERMRGLLLDLAVSGRLVAAKSFWSTKPLKALATKIGSGATPAGGRESYFTDGIPLIRSMNVHFRGFDRTGLVFLSDEQAKELSNVTVQPNDVLLNITGASIGRVTVAPAEIAGARVNQHVTIIRPTSELLPSFLSMFLASPSMQRRIDEIQVGATRQALTKAMIEQFEVPLPPLAEQKRIVAKVDELMALCDQLEAQQQGREKRHAALARASLYRFAEAPTPSNLNFIFHKSYDIAPADLRKSILTLAVRGKLVPQEPNDEPAENLIARAQAERHRLIEAGVIKRAKALSDKNAITVVAAVPVSWAVCTLDDIALKITDGEHATPPRMDRGQYLLSARNVRDGFIDVSDVDYVGTEVFEKIRKRCDPDAGDILLSCSGSIGRVAVVDASNKYAMVRSVAVIKHSKANVDSHFLSIALRSPFLQTQMERSSKQSAQPNLFIEPIRRLVIPIPPLPEQRRIVSKVHNLMAICDRLEQQLQARQSMSTKLLEAVLCAVLTATDQLGTPLNGDDGNVPVAVACYAVSKLPPTLGRVQLAKVLYLAEAHLGLPLDGRYRREAAGPFDAAMLQSVEDEAAQQGWFVKEPRTSGDAFFYRRGPNLEGAVERAKTVLGERRAALDALLRHTATWDTHRAERVATLFAAWNDLKVAGRDPSDGEIIAEFLNNWHHKKKENFSRDELQKELHDMRSMGLVPKGTGPSTKDVTAPLFKSLE